MNEMVYHPAGLFRRLAALFYDVLVLVAVLMVVTALLLPLLHGKILMPAEMGVYAYLYRGAMLLLSALFFAFFWTRQGQTIGMRAWRLRLQRETGALLNWNQALRRQLYVAALWLPTLLAWGWVQNQPHVLGLHLLAWVLSVVAVFDWVVLWFDPQRRTWHDLLSHTQVVVIPRCS